MSAFINTFTANIFNFFARTKLNLRFDFNIARYFLFYIVYFYLVINVLDTIILLNF